MTKKRRNKTHACRSFRTALGFPASEVGAFGSRTFIPGRIALKCAQPSVCRSSCIGEFVSMMAKAAAAGCSKQALYTRKSLRSVHKCHASSPELLDWHQVQSLFVTGPQSESSTSQYPFSSASSLGTLAKRACLNDICKLQTAFKIALRHRQGAMSLLPLSGLCDTCHLLRAGHVPFPR